MSDLLNQASLVMIPSGYKEDTVYSAVPTDGSGDLSFTRSSNGTRVNSAGFVESVSWNLLQNTNSLSSGWSNYQSSSTSGQSDPIGGTNAIKLLYNTTNNYHSIIQNISLSGNNAHSVYAKAGELSFLQIGSAQSIEEYANFNLSTGAIGAYGTYASNVQIESVGNGWYRCSVVFTNGSNGIYFALVQSASSGWFGVSAYAGANNTNGLYLYGAQVNAGSIKPYFPTTDRLNVPRLTYQNGGGGCPSLLLEKQSTNILTHSEDFTQWLDAGGTITANTAISPDGTQNADTLTGARFQIIFETGIFTLSCYAKKVNGDNKFVLRFDIPTTVTAQFDLNTGIIDSVSSGYSATITSVGNGWYRCTFTNNSSVTITNAVIVSATGGTYSTYVWGAQLEESSYPTSYIPTTSSSATRVADACYKTGISSLIGQTSGTILWDLQVDQLLSSENILNIDDGAGFGQTIYFIKGSSGQITAEVYVSGAAQCSLTYSLPSVGRYKIAFAYANNDFALYVNGVARGTDSSGSVPPTSRLQMGQGALGSSDGKVNELVLFKTRLTNAELSSLTTI